MAEGRRLIAELMMQKDLAGSGIEQITPADYLGDTHERIIYHDGELMSWTIIELNEYGGRVHQQGYDSDGTPSPWGSF